MSSSRAAQVAPCAARRADQSQPGRSPGEGGEWRDQYPVWRRLAGMGDRFEVSASLPLSLPTYRGVDVPTVFDNLLPDRDAVRRRAAEHVSAARRLQQPA